MQFVRADQLQVGDVFPFAGSRYYEEDHIVVGIGETKRQYRKGWPWKRRTVTETTVRVATERVLSYSIPGWPPVTTPAKLSFRPSTGLWIENR